MKTRGAPNVPMILSDGCFGDQAFTGTTRKSMVDNTGEPYVYHEAAAMMASDGPERLCEVEKMRGRRAEGGLRAREEAGGAHQYKMKERLVDIGDDYWIEDHAGNKAFKVDGKALRVRNTLLIQSKEGKDLYKIQERMLRIKDTMEIEKGEGGTAATIKKAMIAPLRERWTVSIPGGEDWEVQGNILDHEYQIEAGRRERVAEVSKKWFRVRDTYGVEVEPGHDDALVLAITAAIDQMAH